MTCYEIASAGVKMVTDHGRLWLSDLLGMVCGLDGANGGPPRARGLWACQTAGGMALDDASLELVDAHVQDHAMDLTLRWVPGGMMFYSRWQWDPVHEVLTRQDSVEALDGQAVELRRLLGQVVLSPGAYAMYSQGGAWCDENQGRWLRLAHETVSLQSEGGRTTQGSTPYLGLMHQDTGRGVVFHLLPVGDWVIRVSCATGARVPRFATVQLGLSDDSLALTLEAGRRLDLPTVWMQRLEGERIEQAAPGLHGHVAKHYTREPQTALPVVYNTWFDVFEHLNPDRLETQLEAAAAVGCEVFTVDAGWYGAGPGNWGLQTGDWREKPHAAFRGQMKAFAQRVRARGLGFGLWMEPERLGTEAPILQSHPEYFLPGANGQFYPDMTRAAAYDYIRGELSRLIETYELAWMKLDFNFELERDPYGRSFEGYYRCWYHLLDEIKQRYPNTVLEGCSSGGLRTDIASVCHYDCHFLSDTVYPVDTLRIMQGAALRLLPGRLGAWAVVRGLGRGHYPYGTPLEVPAEMTVTAVDATWENAAGYSLDFICQAASLGVFGLSGDLASLSVESRKVVQRYTAFAKQWGAFKQTARVHLLTPVKPRSDSSGWVGFQCGDGAGSLVFAYRLDFSEGRQVWRLRGLCPEAMYEIRTVLPQAGEPAERRSGRDLMEQGLALSLPKRYSGAVVSLQCV